MYIMDRAPSVIIAIHRSAGLKLGAYGGLNFEPPKLGRDHPTIAIDHLSKLVPIPRWTYDEKEVKSDIGKSRYCIFGR